MSIRHFRKVTDLTAEEVDWVFERAAQMKRDGLSQLLCGKTIALIFSKPSTRTRVSFSVGVHQMGGMPLFLGENEIQMRKSESIEDTARVLSRYVDAIVIRTFAQADVDDLAANATIPVINALTDERHPRQGLTDLFTFEERFADAKGRQITYLGDGNNVAESLAAAGAMRGVDVCLSVPEGYDLPLSLWEELQALAAAQGTRIWVERDPHAAIRNASALYTDVWISMGQEKAVEKLAALTPYRIDAALLAAAPADAVVMHCLPAHRGEEITSEVMDGLQSIVFDQAENRLHVQKSLMALLVGE